MKSGGEIGEIKNLIRDKQITLFKEIFQHTTIKSVSVASKIKYGRMRKIVLNPGSCTVAEVNLLAHGMHVDHLVIVTLVKDQCDQIK